MRIYIAAPYSASTARKVQINVSRAIAAFCMLLTRGYIPYLPHLMHYVWLHPAGDFAYDVWLEQGMRWLEACDGIYRMPGESKGADAEVAHAKQLGIPVYNSLEELPTLATEKEA